MDIISAVLAQSSLEELEMLQPINGLDFSRQLGLKRLAIDASLLTALPSLVDLEHLAVINVDSTSVEVIERFTQVSRLTLVGEHYAVSRVDEANFPRLKDINVEVTSVAEQVQVRSAKATMAATLTFTPDDTFTNATFTSALCAAYNSSVTALKMEPTASSTKWFRLPACLSTWTTLESVDCLRCQVPNFTVLPSSITGLSFQSVRGSWTQREAGTDTGINGDYFDWNWLPNLPNLVSILINGVNGTLPNHLTHAKVSQFYFSQYYTTATQHLVGTIAPDFFTRYPALRTFELGYNKMTGTIPYHGLEKLRQMRFGINQFTHWPSLTINATNPTHVLSVIDLSDNQLVEIPSDASFQQMPNLTIFNIARNRALTAPFPNLFNTVLSRTSANVLATITASNCNLTGTLPAIPASQISMFNAATTNLSWSFDQNHLSGTIPASWSGLSFIKLNLSTNAGLNGTLATLASNGSIVSQFIKTAASLTLDGSGYSGAMFNLTSMTTLQNVTVEAPNVDFCGNARRLPASTRPLIFPSATVNYCELSTTNASHCHWAFPSVCRTDAVPPSANCPLPSPGPSFVCEGSVWISYVDVTQVNITIPSHTVVIVNGSLTTGSLIIHSIGSTITVTGCITASDGTTVKVTLVLTQADLEEIIKRGGSLTTQLIRQGDQCAPLDPSSFSIDTSAFNSCKSIKTDKVDTSAGLAATFTVSSSKCNTWWIILVSVLCGLLLIALIIFVIVYTVCQAKKRKAAHKKLQDREARG